MLSSLILFGCINEEVTETKTENNEKIEGENITENNELFTVKLEEMDKLLVSKQYDEILQIYNDIQSEKGFNDFGNVEDINAIHKLVNANNSIINRRYDSALRWLDKVPQDYSGKYTNQVIELRNLIVEQETNDLLVDINKKDFESIKDNYYFSTSDGDGYAIWMYGSFLGTAEWAASFKGVSSAETYGSTLGSALEYLENVPDDYSGRFSDEIETEREKYKKLVMIENRKVERENKLLSIPEIGMTDYEVVETSWGKPEKINKTETAFGINEQWVYDKGYLYFEDHYLMSIQSSR